MKRITRRNTPLHDLDLVAWPEVSIDHLDTAAKEKFIALKSAVTRYVQGDKVQDIEADQGVDRESLLRALNRCMTPGPHRGHLGWAGLLPGKRVKGTGRIKPLVPKGRNGRAGLTGALGWFFMRHQTIKLAFDEYLLSTAKAKDGYENKVRHITAHGKFIGLCKDNGADPTQWPLNMDKRGKGAIYKYVNEFLDQHFDAIVATQYGQKAKTASAAGTGTYSRLRAERYLDVVELDEHLCHFPGGWIAFDTPGGVRWVKGPRLTLIALVDRFTGLVVGFTVIFRSQTNADDVLDALFDASEGASLLPEADQAAEPWLPRDLGIPFTSCGFNQLLVDNALSHLATQVLKRVSERLGCDINFGPVRRPERRPHVEGLFSHLERFGFHRLRETTGSGPQDPLRVEAPPKSESQMTETEAISLIRRAIRAYNRHKSKGAYGVRRIEQLQGLMQDSERAWVFPVLPPRLDLLPGLDISIFPLKVRGKEESGKRPHVYFNEESYFSPELSDRWKLIGKSVIAHLDRRDARFLRLFESDGTPLGVAQVRGRWRHSPHTADTRVRINKWIRDGQLPLGHDEDPIAAHLEHVGQGISHAKKPTREQSKAVAEHVENEHALQSRAQNTSHQDLNRLLDEARRAAAAHETRPEEDEDLPLYALPDLKSINRGGRT